MKPVPNEAFLDKVLLVDKPLNWTSFDVVAKLRRLTGIKKIGHAGTLDPLATGLLIICTGKATKQIDQFMGLEKEYETGIRFGGTTASYDAEFPPENIKDCSHLTRAMIESALAEFTGEITQVPPAFSAVKKEGKRAYELAREGKPVELKSRQVVIHEFSLVEFVPPDYAFTLVRCSKGTYIRSLAHDLGQKLGTGAWVQSLRRTAIGPHRVENAWKIDDFAAQIKNQKETRESE